MFRLSNPLKQFFPTSSFLVKPANYFDKQEVFSKKQINFLFSFTVKTCQTRNIYDQSSTNLYLITHHYWRKRNNRIRRFSFPFEGSCSKQFFVRHFPFYGGQSTAPRSTYFNLWPEKEFFDHRAVIINRIFGRRPTKRLGSNSGLPVISFFMLFLSTLLKIISLYSYSFRSIYVNEYTSVRLELRRNRRILHIRQRVVTEF